MPYIPYFWYFDMFEEILVSLSKGKRDFEMDSMEAKKVHFSVSDMLRCCMQIIKHSVQDLRNIQLISFFFV